MIIRGVVLKQITDRHIPEKLGRSTSGFHRPRRRYTKSGGAVRCWVIRTEGGLYQTTDRPPFPVRRTPTLCACFLDTRWADFDFIRKNSWFLAISREATMYDVHKI